jgi:flavodoxin
MNILIVFDSQFGNTNIIAQAINDGIPQGHSVSRLSAGEFSQKQLDDIYLLIIGSPTQGGRPTPKVLSYLDSIPTDGLQKIQCACFDTRLLEQDQNFALKLLMKAIGYAAPKIAELLIKKGGVLIVPPEGFIVTKKEGPLKDGEEMRAKAWAKNIISK